MQYKVIFLFAIYIFKLFVDLCPYLRHLQHFLMHLLQLPNYFCCSSLLGS